MPVILRHNMGSRREVRRVFAFDPGLGEALVLLRDKSGYETLHEMILGEFEALDEKQNYVSVEEQLKKRADFILNRES